MFLNGCVVVCGKEVMRQALRVLLPDLDERQRARKKGLTLDEYREAMARHQRLMRLWRGIGRCIAPLREAQARAASRAYAPHGAGYKRARDEFESLVDGPAQMARMKDDRWRASY